MAKDLKERLQKGLDEASRKLINIKGSKYEPIANDIFDVMKECISELDCKDKQITALETEIRLLRARKFNVR